MRDILTNPTTVEDLRELPAKFWKIKKDDDFLLYDSYEDQEYDLNCGRILILASREILRTLFRCAIWSEGIHFTMAPLIFVQLFVIMDAVSQRYNNVEQAVTIPSLDMHRNNNVTRCLSPLTRSNPSK